MNVQQEGKHLAPLECVAGRMATLGTTRNKSGRTDVKEVKKEGKKRKRHVHAVLEAQVPEV